MNSISGSWSFFSLSCYSVQDSLTLLWNGNFTLTWTHTVMGSSFTCLLLGKREELRNFLLYIKPCRCPQLNDGSTCNSSKAIYIQKKLYFKFWILIFFWANSAGQGVSTAPVTHTMMNGNNQYTRNHPVLRLPFCFTLPVWYSINCTRGATLYYKVGFVLGDFAQL